MPTSPERERLVDKIRHQDKVKPRFGNLAPTLLATKPSTDVVESPDTLEDMYGLKSEQRAQTRKSLRNLGRKARLRQQLEFEANSGDIYATSLADRERNEAIRDLLADHDRATKSTIAAVAADEYPYPPVIAKPNKLRSFQRLETIPELSTRASVPPRLRYNSEVKRAILIELRRTPRASTIEICRGLDAVGDLDLPTGWRSNKRGRSFEEAYRTPKIRHRIDAMVTKVRTDLRKAGLSMDHKR